MATTVVGLFDDQDAAQQAVQDLLDSGTKAESISAVASDPEGKYRNYSVDEQGTMGAEGLASGAASGAIVGGVFGLLMGIGALAFPALGVVVLGPLAATAVGAGIGAVSGGIIGGLLGLGVPEVHAHAYAEGVRRGGTLITVIADEADADRVRGILDRDGAVDIEKRGSSYRQQGWTHFDPKAAPLTTAEMELEQRRLQSVNGATNGATTSGAQSVPTRVRTYSSSVAATYDAYDADFRKDWQSRYGQAGTYDDYAPAYRYGYKLASDPTYANRKWEDVETDARTGWEAEHSTAWDDFKESVKSAWDQVLGRRMSDKASLY